MALDGEDAASPIVEQFPALDDVDLPTRLLLMLVQSRLLLAQGQQANAAAQLEARYQIATHTGWQSAVVETRVLQALITPALLTEALALAEPEGYVRAFVDLGEPMAALLREAATQGVATSYIRTLLSAFDAPLPPAHIPDQPLVEPLSERELDVMHHLVDGQTNQEIAQTLCISVNTVKTHLKNIYGKLGVSSRRQAAAEANKLGLVP
ncbi:MAG: response regulator transcription factor [Chloroflexi bacterium]|nr:response regulator transcription factor [Chloroflexota bacterium]